VADARALVDRARLDAQINRLTYESPVQVRTLVRKLCDFKQTYTQYGGVRPFGTALLVGGVDGSGSHLFATDPSGALMEYKATAEGEGRDAAIDYFEEHYKEGMSRDDAVILGIKTLIHATEGKIEKRAIEIGLVDKDAPFSLLTSEETDAYYDKAAGE
jgi:proteasome alpha subunit